MSEFLIEDGKGRGYKASVSSVNRLNVSSKTNARIYYNSRETGDAFSFTSDYSACSCDYVIYIKNDNETKNMVISDICVSAANSAKWEFQRVSGTGSSCCVIAGRALNFSKNTTADVTSRGNSAVSSLNETYSFTKRRTAAGAGTTIDFDESVILGRNDAIAIKYIGTAGNVEVTIRVHFEVHSTGVN